MDLQKAKIILEKINSLHKSMNADARNVSVIEKDLMRNYILQLYECMLDLPTSAKTLEVPQVEIIKSAPPVILHKLQPVIPEPEKPAPKIPVSKAVLVEEDEEEEVVAPTRVSEKAPPQQIQSPSVNKMGSAVTPDLEDIFNLSSGRDLADKLSQLPITDIKKSMGVNERIFTMNELFGGDQVVFDRALNSLNSFANFDEAKEYLAQNFAAKYSWVEKEKKSKAKNFVKLVKRRYS